MHIEFLIEDVSGKRMLELLVPKILPGTCTYKIHAYKGIGGKIPTEFKNDPKTARHRILLENLPRLLSGYGRTFHDYGKDYRAAVVVVCDLDRRDKNTFESELNDLLRKCDYEPDTKFCLAIEEGEAWYLGDQSAVLKVYPACKKQEIRRYKQDSICGTWEKLANAIYPGGSSALLSQGRQAIGKAKFDWAEKITPHMDVNQNKSPSFCKFRDTVKGLSR